VTGPPPEQSSARDDDDGWMKNGWMKKWIHNDDGWMDEDVGT
jgi:hypothetical protein